MKKLRVLTRRKVSSYNERALKAMMKKIRVQTTKKTPYK